MGDQASSRVVRLVPSPGWEKVRMRGIKTVGRDVCILALVDSAERHDGCDPRLIKSPSPQSSPIRERRKYVTAFMRRGTQ